MRPLSLPTRSPQPVRPRLRVAASRLSGWVRLFQTVCAASPPGGVRAARAAAPRRGTVLGVKDGEKKDRIRPSRGWRGLAAVWGPVGKRWASRAVRKRAQSRRAPQVLLDKAGRVVARVRLRVCVCLRLARLWSFECHES